MTESEIQQLIQMEAVKHSCILMRNNSGALKDSTGRLVRYGLGNVSAKQSANFKSSDLIGFRTMVITPEMLGRTVAIFTSVECKVPGWFETKRLDQRETAQNNFLKWVRDRGGFAGFAQSVEDMEKIIGAR